MDCENCELRDEDDSKLCADCIECWHAIEDARDNREAEVAGDYFYPLEEKVRNYADAIYRYVDLLEVGFKGSEYGLGKGWDREFRVDVEELEAISRAAEYLKTAVRRRRRAIIEDNQKKEAILVKRRKEILDREAAIKAIKASA